MVLAGCGKTLWAREPAIRETYIVKRERFRRKSTRQSYVSRFMIPGSDFYGILLKVVRDAGDGVEGAVRAAESIA